MRFLKAQTVKVCRGGLLTRAGGCVLRGSAPPVLACVTIVWAAGGWGGEVSVKMQIQISGQGGTWDSAFSRAPREDDAAGACTLFHQQALRRPHDKQGRPSCASCTAQLPGGITFQDIQVFSG